MEPILIFNVSNQEIERMDDFTVVESSVSYLKAQFNFQTDDWAAMTIITGVFIMEDGTPIPSLADENNICSVPEAWLVKQKGYVGVIGSDGTTKITTRAAKVTIKETGYSIEPIEAESSAYFDQIMQSFAETKLFVTQEANRAEAAEEAAGAYAAKTAADATQTIADRTAVVLLAENIFNMEQTVASNLAKTEELTSQAQTAAENALQFEQTAKASEIAAQAAQAGAEAAEGQAELYAAQTEEDKNTVKDAKALVMQIGQEIADNKASVEQTVSEFGLEHQQAVADVNNAGQTQTERVQETGESAVGDITAAKNNALSEIDATGNAQKQAVETAGATHLKNVTDAGTAQTQAVNAVGTAKTAEVNAAGTTQLGAVNNAGAVQVATVTQEGETQVANVQEAAAGIIADRDQIEINRQNLLKNVISGEASGTVIPITGSADYPFLGMRQYGRTEQFTTTGKNLLNPNQIIIGGIAGSGGADFATANRLRTAYIPVIANTTYTLSGYDYVINSVHVYDDNMVWIKAISANANNNISMPENAGCIRINWKKSDESDFTDEELAAFRSLSIQLEKGSVATAYEPYTGGKPSPNVDYQQELVNAGDEGEFKTVVAGKNLYNKNRNYSATGETNPFLTHGDIVTSQSTNIQVPVSLDLKMIIGKTVTVSFDIRCDVETDIDVYAYQNSGISVSVYADTSIVQVGNEWARRYVIGKVVNMPVLYGNYGRLIFYNANLKDNNLQLKNLQIQLGAVSEEETEYTPYEEQVLSFSTPNGLPGIPVTSGGNYTDENGQQWVADYRDWGRGVDVQRLWKGTFDGTEDWSIYPSGSGFYSRILPGIMNARDGFTNMLKVVKSSGDVVIDNAILGANNNVLYVLKNKFYDSSLSDSGLNNWKQHLAEHPLEVMTYLDTSIETPIPAEELAAYRALYTNNPYTIIYNDDEVYTEVEYVLDMETYMESEHQKLSEECSQKTEEVEQNLISRIGSLGFSINPEDGGLDIIIYDE